MSAALHQQTDEDLRSTLLTVDGKGRAAKEAALTELLARAEARGYHQGLDDERAEPTPPDSGRQHCGPSPELAQDAVPQYSEGEITWCDRLWAARGSVDDRCLCDCSKVCPLGRAGSMDRCTVPELEAHGRAKGWLP